MSFLTDPKRVMAVAYLRCYPFEPWGMALHRDALEQYSRSLGFAELPVLLDNGVPSEGPKPYFDQLISLVAADVYHVVFVPGLWVFAIGDEDATVSAGRLTDLGCRIVELPSPRSTPWDWTSGPMPLGMFRARGGASGVRW
ncbi:hypothetical protein ABZT27_14570 [Streptomyces sp. NPDC005389]|uniref:hypothetical protein n=1 Tax=Streptomyces sp. NPDC005389 TaxID=3157040 RepID=UPI0033A9E026